MRRFLLAAMILGTVSGAQAADLPFLRGGFTDGLTTAKVNWQGYYVGGQGGLGTSDMDFTGATQPLAAKLLSGTAIENIGGVSSWPLGGKVSAHGNGIGAFAGYNAQWDDVVLGVEFSYLHGKFGGSQIDSMTRFFDAGGGYTDTVTYDSIARVSVSDMASLRFRAAYAFGSFLPYAFGGVALGQADIVKTAHIYGNQINPAVLPPFNNVPFDLSATDAKNSHFIYGYSWGLGVDVMLCAGLFLRAEWEFNQFAASVDTSVNTGRVGLGYKF